MSLYRDQLEKKLKVLDIKATNLLDIGGSAYPLEKRVNTWDVKNYYIFDNNNEKEYHEKWKPADIIGDICLNPMSWQWPKAVPESFDYISLLEVAEYFVDPVSAVQHISSLLDDGGTFLSSWPTIYPLHQPIDSDMLRYSLSWIRRVFKESNLLIEEITPRKLTTGIDSMFESYSKEGMKVAKNTDKVLDMGYIILATKLKHQ